MLLCKLLYLFFYGIVVAIVEADQNVGELCTIQSTGRLGKCTPILNCPQGLTILKKNMLPPICGHRGTALIICCEDSTISTANFSQPSSTTTSATISESSEVTETQTQHEAENRIYTKSNIQSISSAIFAETQIGGDCIVQSTSQVGKCSLISNCPNAVVDIFHLLVPQFCGSYGNNPLVCCPNLGKQPKTSQIVMSNKLNRIPGELSRQKCREYGKYVSATTRIPILLVNAPDVSVNECGFSVEPLVVGGKKALTKEFPHQAAIGYEPSPGNVTWNCGGSIISENYILTAAHCCLKHINLGYPKYVQVGINHLNAKSEYKRQNIKIEKCITHPEYKLPSSYNDVALIKLSTPIDLNPFARPACLFTENEIPTDKAIATGWGATAYAGVLNDDLMKVVLQFEKLERCSMFHKPNWKLKRGIDSRTQLCAGDDDEDDDKPKDTCQGDSGGPLQIYHDKSDVKCMYDIVGITSFGKACGGVTPGVYTRVSHYIDWIETIVWP